MALETLCINLMTSLVSVAVWLGDSAGLPAGNFAGGPRRNCSSTCRSCCPFGGWAGAVDCFWAPGSGRHWLGLFGIRLPFTTAAVVQAQIFVSASLFVRAARIGFANIDPYLEDAAHVDGPTYSRFSAG